MHQELHQQAAAHKPKIIINDALLLGVNHTVTGSGDVFSKVNDSFICVKNLSLVNARTMLRTMLDSAICKVWWRRENRTKI